MMKNKLKQLLNEKWSLDTDKTIQGRIMNEHNRKIFSEGYNAAIQEVMPLLKELKSDLWYQIESKFGPEEASKYPSYMKAEKLLRESHT